MIHICLGAEFSCYQNASLAAQSFSNVYVIDSQNLSTVSGHLVYEAALMAREGMGAEEICRRLAELIPRVDASFVIERVNYLYKGGRCSGLEAFGARLIKIKPSIEVINGKMTVGKKYRGSFERCLEQYVQNKLDSQVDIDYSMLFITNTSSEHIVGKVQEVVRSYANFEEIILTKADVPSLATADRIRLVFYLRERIIRSRELFIILIKSRDLKQTAFTVRLLVFCRPGPRGRVSL